MIHTTHMKRAGGICIALVSATGLFGQPHSGAAPVLTGGFGNVVYPGGTSATNPAITRTPPNVVFPGGGGPHLVIPGSGRRSQSSTPLVYAYPVYVNSGYYDSSYYQTPAQQLQQQQPNITVIYPPVSGPVIVNPYAQPGPPETAESRMTLYQPRAQEAPAEEASSTAEHYLIAFKDHTIYSAVAYWVEGDTLHYFTSGNTHNQASISLVDRELTGRLNKDSGLEVKLPKAK